MYPQIHPLLDIFLTERYNLSMSTPEFVAGTPTAAPDLAHPSPSHEQPVARSIMCWQAGLVLCTLAFLCCILLTVTPLMRMPDSLIHLHIGWGAFLGEASRWLPANLGATYQQSSASIEFFNIITLAFLCYCLGALLVGCREEEMPQITARVCIWLGLLVAGAIYVVTPGVLSHDMLAYAGYSRLLAVYHANPYFVTLSAFPADPLTPLDQWSHVISVYGPIWLFVSYIPGWLLKPTPESYVIALRVFALAMHVLNTWLVDRVLRTMGRSQRTRVLGMLLYGWNPLVLLESGLNGHNDVFMLTFVLLGILLVARAEQRGELLRARGYLPPIVALTLAVLVKFTILPVVAAYVLFLACKALRPSAESPLAWKQALRDWRPVAWLLFWSCVVPLLLALVLYAPFWLGHSPRTIIGSFTNSPAGDFAENSYQRSIINWLNFHPQQRSNFLWLFFSWRQVWNVINYIAILLCLLVGVRRLWIRPTVRVFLALTLAMMCIVLLLTPWFFTWYITWIVGLAVVCLPAHPNRVVWSFFMLTLTFSYSALSLYLFNHELLGPNGYLVSLFDTVPPICAFLLCWFVYPRLRTGASELTS